MKTTTVYTNISLPYMDSVAFDMAKDAVAWRMFGRNPDVDNIREDVWEIGGIYQFPPDGGIQMKISSSSANDTGNGTGARTVDIHYLNHLYEEKLETITLNGVTAVSTTTTNILRINDMHIMSAGTGLVCDGNVSLTNIAGTIIYGYVAANSNASRQCVYTVPANKALYISSWGVGIGNSSGNRFGEFHLRATTSRAGEYTKDLFHYKDLMYTQDGSLTRLLLPVEKCVAKSDVKVSVESDSPNANAITCASCRGILEQL